MIRFNTYLIVVLFLQISNSVFSQQKADSITKSSYVETFLNDSMKAII